MKNLEYAKNVTQAVIYKKGRAAATLTRSPGLGVVFSYLSGYLHAAAPPSRPPCPPWMSP